MNISCSQFSRDDLTAVIGDDMPLTRNGIVE